MKGLDVYTDYGTICYAEIIYTPNEYAEKKQVNLEEFK